MTPSIAIIFLRGGGPVTSFEIILFLLVAGAVMLVAICWGYSAGGLNALVAAAGRQSRP